MKEIIYEKINTILKGKYGIEPPQYKVETPKDEKLGDLASNVSFLLARTLRNNPVKIAEELASELSSFKEFEKVEAVRGFLNFTFSEDFVKEEIKKVLEGGENYFKENLGKGKKVQIEFVSANPTGPLHLGHGRGAVIGDSLARLMEFFGFNVTREYYINDAGRQVYLLGVSVLYRYQELFNKVDEKIKEIFEKDGYKGEYVKEIAELLKKVVGDLIIRGEIEKAYEKIISSELPFEKNYIKKFSKNSKEPHIELCTLFGLDMMMDEIRRDLKEMDIDFDVWFSERSLYESRAVEKVIEKLKEKGYVYENEGALWLKTSEFGDDKDRVIVKSDGSYTYFAPDIAYHLNKYERGFEKVINLWGADHYGYIPRIKAALKMLGIPEDWLEIYLIQTVKLFREGKEVKMSKRAGNFVTLRELMDSVGKDAVRFVFLTKKSDTPLDIDVDLIKEKSSENPVFYVQYAHARISGIFREVKERYGMDAEKEDFSEYLKFLKEEPEIKLMKKVLMMKDELREIVLSRDPHLITYYLMSLSKLFHNYYNHYRIIGAEENVMKGRLALLKAIKISIYLGLKLIGVSAPERM